jgi:hypothetical protein
MKVARLMLSITVSVAALSKSCFNLQMVRMNLRKLFRLFLLALLVHFVYAQQPQRLFFRVTLGSNARRSYDARLSVASYVADKAAYPRPARNAAFLPAVPM